MSLSVMLDEGESWKMLHGNAKNLLAELPDNSIDFICTDPPYNLGLNSAGNISVPWRTDFNNYIADWDQIPFQPKEWKDELLRVLKPTGNLFVFTSYNLIGKWHEEYDPIFDTFQFMVWHKTNPPPKLRRAGFLNSCELIACMWNSGHTWNFTKQAEMHNFIETPICMGKERLKNPKHATQKPVKVMRRLVELASDPGDIVLDPFAGVGSTGVAALQLGRRFIGFDLEKPYVDAATERLKSVTVDADV